MTRFDICLSQISFLQIYKTYIKSFYKVHSNFYHYFINIDVCAKAMEPAITTPTLHPVTILVTRTIFFACLKNISRNYLFQKNSRISKETTDKISLSCLIKS